MPKYRVKPGYCLHLPYGRFAHPGEEVELSGQVEAEILAQQGWKVQKVMEPPVQEPQSKPEPEAEAETEPEPEAEAETEAVEKPPKDRAVKRSRVVK
ncbi:MAG: hypothetical protein JRI66_12910 [Deltaproteobacteria bacterium]|nr:hypothetical protein [Deltaproteobacteria bacterium]